MPASASIEDLLGLGYTGTALIDGKRLLLRGSSISQEPSWIRSGGRSTVISNSTGGILIPNRNVLNLNLQADLTVNSLSCARINYLWRSLNLNGKVTTGTVYIGTGEGFLLNEAYVEQINIASPENSLTQVSFSIKSYDWTDLSGSPTPRENNVGNPRDVANQPIPHWKTSVTHSAHPGIPVAWSINIAHGYQYYQFCEGYLVPPVPKAVVPGPLQWDLNLTTLARPGERPELSATGVNIDIDGSTITIPSVRLDPSKTSPGFGEQNSILRWQASWKALGNAPSN
jgi:hypothetical protein